MTAPPALPASPATQPPHPAVRPAAEATLAVPPARACANCGTPAPLAYCPACGQEQHDYHRTLRALSGELLDTFAGWDGKIPLTLWVLVRYPGRLTAEFLAGHRVRYLRPLRLYLSLSVVFFLALRAVRGHTSGGTNFSVDFQGTSVAVVGGAADSARADSLEAALARTDSALARTRGARGRPAGDAAPAARARPDGWANRWYKERKRALAAMPRAERVRAVREQLQGNVLPNMVFVLLPVFALFVKLLYWRSPVFYAEHLVFALHVHAFFMVAMAAARVAPVKGAALAAVAWMAVYVFVALRRVYGGSRRRTLVKLAGLLATYGVVLVVAVSVGAVLAIALAA